ncbi:hypothetical protein [Candidatus Leptofilum sp.]|uniref:hypothetical protein n=1 Tax=Candidatus Leptofilum sp. TaxID=3241576 RepID=UPI003B5AFEAE
MGVGAWIILLLLLVSTVTACTEPTQGTQTPLADLPVPTSPAIPPTFTPLPPGSELNVIPVVTVTQEAIPTRATNTPIPFGANVVELHLTIPSLGLDRRLQGSVNSQIILVDESNGFSVQRDNQASVLLDLQQVLPELVTNAVPEGCDTCVHVTYNLPFSGVAGEGWLRDPVLLASLENYFTITLGPHFPPGAMIGLRRSASAYAPAHSVAVMEDGRLFRWMANQGEVEPVGVAPPALLAAFEAVDAQALSQQYTAPCPGSPLESLLLAGREQQRLIALVCPEFSVPSTLQPLYVALDDALNEMLTASEATLPRPPAAFPLDAMLDYQRVDGAQLTIFIDNTAVASLNNSQPISTTLSSSQVISLTNNLLASGSLRTGLTTFLSDEDATAEEATATAQVARSLLLLRGPGGVYDAEWIGTSNVDVLVEVNVLLNELLSGETAVPDQTPIATPEEGETAVPETTPTPTFTATPDGS